MYFNVGNPLRIRLSEIMRSLTGDSRYNFNDIIDITFYDDAMRIIFRDRDAREQRKAKKIYLPYNLIKSSLDIIKERLRVVDHIIFKQ